MAKRFIMEELELSSLGKGTRLIIDTETGVQYLMAHWTNVGGLTALLGADGKPLLDKRFAKESPENQPVNN